MQKVLDRLPENLVEGCGTGQRRSHSILVWIQIQEADPGIAVLQHFCLYLWELIDLDEKISDKDWYL